MRTFCTEIGQTGQLNFSFLVTLTKKRKKKNGMNRTYDAKMKYFLIVLYFLLLLSTTLPSGNKKKVQATEYNDTNRVLIIHVSNIYQYPSWKLINYESLISLYLDL